MAELPALRSAVALIAGPGRRAAWRRRVVRKVVAVALVLAAVVTLVGLLHPPAPESQVQVPVAARALPAGTRIGDADVRQVAVPRSLAGSAAGSARSRDAVVGHVLAGAVEAGEPLRASRLLVPGTLRTLADDEVAAPVTLTSPSVSEAVRVGDRVDVVVAGTVAAHDVPVLAVTRPTVSSGLGGGDAYGPGRQAELLLGVPRVDAVALAAPSEAGGAAPPVVLLRPGDRENR